AAAPGLAVGWAAGAARAGLAGEAVVVVVLAGAGAAAVAVVGTGVRPADARSASLTGVPAYGAAFCGVPFWPYWGLRSSMSTTVGAPVSSTRVPAAGVCAATRFAA